MTPKPRSKKPRRAVSYRAAKRNLARDKRLLWRHLPRVNTRNGNVVVVIP